jgi:Cu+-exporting ATPase
MTAASLHLKLGGMHCSLCVTSVERALRRLPGVEQVHVSIAHEEVLVRYDPQRVTPGEIRRTLEALGFAPREPDEAALLAAEGQQLADARRRALQAGILLVLTSGLMLAVHVSGPGPAGMLAVAALALYTAAGPARFLIFRNGWQSLRRGILNQDVLVSASALAGLTGGFAGLLGTDFPAGEFFGAAVFVLAFHLMGGYASVAVHVRASQSVRRLLALLPPTARRLTPEGAEEEVPVDWLRPGDRVRVRPGERIPVDGRVVEGTLTADESLVTGEPWPVDRLPGDEVIGGSFNLAGAGVVEVTRVGEGTFLRTVARQVAEARALKPGILRLVDRVLVVYVPLVFGLAAFGFSFWSAGAALLWGQPDLRRAALAALSILIMGYPCALGMATPLAVIRASGEAAARGILFRSPEAFHVFRAVNVIVFDKTGTLTLGKPAVAAVRPVSGWAAEELLRLAAGAELPSEHPLGRAVVDAARARGLDIPAPAAFSAEPGLGVRAVVGGRRVLVGSPRLLSRDGVAADLLRPLMAEVEARGGTAVLVAVDGLPAGVIGLGDRVRADAPEAVRALKDRGITPMLFTGDGEQAARTVAQAVGVEHVRARLLPGEKAAAVRELQEAGRRVAFVGDGINDAPALMQADVGIALGTGADITLEAADVVIVSDRLGRVVEALELAARSYGLTLRNVALALAFNGAGLLAALTGRVTPIWAMGAMAASVSLVVLSSLLARLLPERAAGGVRELTLKVPDIHCEACLGRIRRAVGRLGGVEGVTGDPELKLVRVAYREGAVDPEAIRAAVKAAGFKVG